MATPYYKLSPIYAQEHSIHHVIKNGSFVFHQMFTDAQQSIAIGHDLKTKD